MKTPLDVAYEAMIDSLTRVPLLRKHLRLGNIIAYTTEDDPSKGTITGGDLPEVAIYFVGIAGNLHQNSDGTKITVSYRFDVSTGSYNSRLLNAVVFGVWAALLNWKHTLHAALWNDRAFIKDVRVNSSPLGLSNEDANRQIKGWAAMLAVDIDLYLSTSEVLGLYDVESN